MKPKYIRVVSDLHLEQYMGQRLSFLSEQFIPLDERDAETVLVLCGDIATNIEAQLIPFLATTKKRFARVIYIPGNHEFYGHEMNEWVETFDSAIKREVEGLNWDDLGYATLGTGYEEHEGVRFIYATLWGDGGEDAYHNQMVERGLRDFYVIRMGGKRFTVADMIALYKKQKAQIKEYLSKPFDGKTVVITHHMPSHRLCHPRFGTEVNGGFAGYCDDLLAADNAPNLWIHGHTHDTSDTRLWKTRIVCNPSGYYMEKNSEFNKFGPKFVEIETMNQID